MRDIDGRSDSSVSGDLSDDELTAMALAADPRAPLDPDAVPLFLSDSDSNPLPSWYMPSAVALRTNSSTRFIVAALILGFLVIDACGLCITSGFLTFA